MKQFFKVIAAAAALATASLVVQAQDTAWPTKPITLVVPFAPGGITDNTARLLAKKMGERLGQSVVVDNRPGAGGSLGVDSASRQPPDGYTIVMGTSG
ncbi:MAG: tripartite tricarboxylate transporter substrate binding protein, partial [Ramlibacter sp.]|nr:tripartite tricarboxylate transporter substrate binding protein [Ramlibacter sp.]